MCGVERKGDGRKLFNHVIPGCFVMNSFTLQHFQHFCHINCETFPNQNISARIFIKVLYNFCTVLSFGSVILYTNDYFLVTDIPWKQLPLNSVHLILKFSIKRFPCSFLTFFKAISCSVEINMANSKLIQFFLFIYLYDLFT